jgi:hypothetical protein
MKNFALLLLTFIICNTGFAQKGGVKNDNSIGLQKALNEIKDVTEELSNSGEIEGDFDVSIKFNNVVTDETGFELSILFLSFKKSKNKSIENTFTSKYKFSASKKSLLNPFIYNQSLSKALKSGIEAYQNTDAGILSKNGFNLTISFTITKSISGDGSYTIEPITIGASRSRQKKSVHTITIDFKPKTVVQPSETNELIKKTNILLEKTYKLIEKQ